MNTLQATMIIPEPPRSLPEEFSPSQVTQACQGDGALLSVRRQFAEQSLPASELESGHIGRSI